MTPEIFKLIFRCWKEKELNNQKANKRKYLHFDRFIQFHRNIKMFEKYFEGSLKNVSKHAFYPLIRCDIKTPRLKVKTDPNTKVKQIDLEPKSRAIFYSSHFDSLIYSWYTEVLTYYYQQYINGKELEECVLAYLKKGKRCNIDFAKEVFDFVAKTTNENNTCVTLAYDLKSFFDSLNHDILKIQWAKIIKCDNNKLPKDHYSVFKSLTDFTFIQKSELEIRFPIPLEHEYKLERFCSPKQFRENVKDNITGESLIKSNPFINEVPESLNYLKKCGIPQGSPLSACLSNIYMVDFDNCINIESKKRNSLYRRYSDDLIIVCKVNDFEYFNNLIIQTIKKFEVIVNEKKTDITFFKKETNGSLRGFSKKESYKNLQYLGFEFNGNNTYIRTSSMSKYSRRMNSQIEQSIRDAYDPDFGQQNIIFKKRILQKFTDRGSRNFVKYAKRAGNIMNSISISKQIKNNNSKVEKIIKIKKQKIESELESKNKIIRIIN